MPDSSDAERLIDLDERLLLGRHARGDEQAFATLLGAYRAPVYGYLVRSAVPPEARDDLFQEIFLKVHGAAASYQPARPLKPWLFTIVANTVRSYFRSRTVQTRTFSEAEPPVAVDERPGPHRQMVARETAAWLEEAIPALPGPQREVLILACLEQMEQKEVATALQIPINTVKTHLRRARITLATWLAERDALPEPGDAR